MCIQSPYDHIKALIGSRMDEFVRQWNEKGIIYEGDFHFSSVMIENKEYRKAVQQILQEAGCEVSSDGSVDVDYVGPEVSNPGWMYGLFGGSRYNSIEASQMIIDHFKGKI